MAKRNGGFNFGGMGGGNMQKLVLQAQQMQADAERVQSEIGAMEFSATTGGGMVTATVYGRKEVKSITINPECIDPDDAEMLGDMVVSAVNEALRIADTTMNTELEKVTRGMPLGF